MFFSQFINKEIQITLFCFFLQTWIPYNQSGIADDSGLVLSPSEGGPVTPAPAPGRKDKDRNLYTIRAVSLSEIRSIRRHTPTLGWNYIIVVLTTGEVLVQEYPSLCRTFTVSETCKLWRKNLRDGDVCCLALMRLEVGPVGWKEAFLVKFISVTVLEMSLSDVLIETESRLVELCLNCQSHVILDKLALLSISNSSSTFLFTYLLRLPFQRLPLEPPLLFTSLNHFPLVRVSIAALAVLGFLSYAASPVAAFYP